MDAATRKERRDISLEIWKLESARCKVCAGYSAYGPAIKCKCETATKIRALGEQLIAISARKRKGRMEATIKQAKESGLTLELYRILREGKMHHKQINRLIDMTQAEYHQWRYENGLLDHAPRVDPNQNKRSGNQAEQKGLTVEGYRNAKKLGYLDKEIVEKYQIGAWSLHKFKQRNGFTVPRGHNSKYTAGKIREKVKV